MEYKEKLMIDMDDVIVSGGLLYLINQFLGTNYTEADFNEFYMQNIVPESDRKDFIKYLLEKNMYDYCYLNEYVYEVLKILIEKYKVYIATSYVFPEMPRECGLMLLYKHDFLIKQFPFFTTNNFVFLTDKSVLDCEARVDDRVDNLEGANKKILYTAYHNKNINPEILLKQGVDRAKNWLDVKKLLLTK